MAGCHYCAGPIIGLTLDKPQSSLSHVRNRHGDANDARAVMALETEISGQVGKAFRPVRIPRHIEGPPAPGGLLHEVGHLLRIPSCQTVPWLLWQDPTRPHRPRTYRCPLAPLGYVAREHRGGDRPGRFHGNEIVRMVHADRADPPVCAPKSEIDEVFRYRSYSCPSCATIVSGIVVSGIDFGTSYRSA